MKLIEAEIVEMRTVDKIRQEIAEHFGLDQATDSQDRKNPKLIKKDLEQSRIFDKQ